MDPPIQKLLHAVDILCISYYEAFQRKKRASSWNDCHSRIECLDSKSAIKNLLGFRACNFQHASLASGRTAFSSCGADPSKAKKRLSSPTSRLARFFPVPARLLSRALELRSWSWGLEMELELGHGAGGHQPPYQPLSHQWSAEKHVCLRFLNRHSGPRPGPTIPSWFLLQRTAARRPCDATNVRAAATPSAGGREFEFKSKFKESSAPKRQLDAPTRQNTTCPSSP
jgi:hypothetical protein